MVVASRRSRPGFVETRASWWGAATGVLGVEALAGVEVGDGAARTRGWEGEQGGQGWLTAPVVEEKWEGGDAGRREQTAAAQLLYACVARAWRAAVALGRPCFGEDTRRSSASVPRRQRARCGCWGAVRALQATATVLLGARGRA